MKQKILWIIGGADTSGGAGVMRDALTAADLNVTCRFALTLVNVQSDTKPFDVSPVSLTLLSLQLDALMTGRKPDSIKIGAVYNDEQAAVIAIRLSAIAERFPGLPVIWDPVHCSSASGKLSNLSKKGVQQLFSLASLVTPNLSELPLLLEDSVNEALDKRMTSFCTAAGCAVLLKGGHTDSDESRDVLYTAAGSLAFTSARYSAELRGTGCMLATSIASVMAAGYTLDDACCVAKAYINGQFAHSKPQPSGPSHATRSQWPSEAALFPHVHRHASEATAANLCFAPLVYKKPGLYPVVDSVDWLTILLPAGVKIAQLRIKSHDRELLNDTIPRAIALAKHYDCQLFINDHWALAIEHGAYGVHLGQEDLDDADLQAIARAGLRLGISTHGYAELCRAKALSPSYIALGHIFPTQTKIMPSRPQGLDNLTRYVSLCESTPTVAIGGIDVDTFSQVARTGVAAIAMVTGLTHADNPLAEACRLQAEFEQNCKTHQTGGAA